MKLSHWCELLLLAALWGGSFLFMRIAVPVLGPVWLIAVRVLLAGLVLLPLLVQQGRLGHLSRHWRALVVVGGLNSAFPFALLAFATLSLPAGFAAILNGTVPLFGTVVAALWLGERFTPARLAGFGLGFGGVVVLVGRPAVPAGGGFGLAVAAGLVAALMYATAAPYIKTRLAGVPPVAVAAGSQFAATLWLLPLLPFTRPAQLPSMGVVLAVIALAVLCTSGAYILYFRLIQAVGSTRALTVTYLVPLFAMVWGTLVLAEPITLSMGLGCGLVLLGTAVANGLGRPTHQH